MKKNSLFFLILLINFLSLSEFIHIGYSYNSSLPNFTSYSFMNSIYNIKFQYNPYGGEINCNNSTILNPGEEYAFVNNTLLTCEAIAKNGYEFYSWEYEGNSSQNFHELYSFNNTISFNVTEDRTWIINFREKGILELFITYLFYQFPTFSHIKLLFILALFLIPIYIISQYIQMSLIGKLFQLIWHHEHKKKLKKFKKEYNTKVINKEEYIQKLTQQKIKILNNYKNNSISARHYSLLNAEIMKTEKKLLNL